MFDLGSNELNHIADSGIFVMDLSPDNNIIVFDFKDKESQRYVLNIHEVITSILSSVKLTLVGITNKEGKFKASKEFMNWTKEKGFLIHQVYLQKNEGISQLLQLIVQQIDREED